MVWNELLLFIGFYYLGTVILDRLTNQANKMSLGHMLLSEHVIPTVVVSTLGLRFYLVNFILVGRKNYVKNKGHTEPRNSYMVSKSLGIMEILYT